MVGRVMQIKRKKGGGKEDRGSIIEAIKLEQRKILATIIN